MKKSSVALLSVIVMVPALTTGCRSRVDQCNAVIDKMNLAVKSMEKFGKDVQKDAPAAAKTLQAELAAAKPNLESVQIEDERLKKYRTEYIAFLDKVSSAVKTLEGAKNDEDTKKVIDAFNAVEQDEKKIVEGLNGYCSGK